MFKKFLIPVLCAMIIMSCTKEQTNPCSETSCVNGLLHHVLDENLERSCECVCEDDWSGPTCETYIGDPINSQTCENVEYNGRTYSTVEINGKCWFTENLKSETFSNGDPIEGSMDLNNWGYSGNLDQKPFYAPSCWGTPYEHQSGYLYNGFVITDERNICPSGWHVSTDEDWKEVERLIGVPESQVNMFSNGRAYGFGDDLVSTDFYGEGELGLNLTPTGWINSCEITGTYMDGLAEFTIQYWTSTVETPQGTSIYTRTFQNDPNTDKVIARLGRNATGGSAVRCVKD